MFRIDFSRAQITRYLNMRKQQISTAIDEFGRFVMEEFVKNVKKRIEQQDANWVPLDPKYLARKIKEGMDPRILIRTGAYLESIKYERLGKNRYRIFAEGNEELSSYLEFGTDKMPSRPHFRQSFEQVQLAMKQILDRQIKRHVK